MSETSASLPRYLDDHEVYVVEFCDEGLFDAKHPTAALDGLGSTYFRNSEICNRVAAVARDFSDVEAQADEFVCLVKGPRSAFEDLVRERIVSVVQPPDGESYEQELRGDIDYVLSQRSLSFDGVIRELEELTGWSGIHPDWVRATLDSLVESGLVSYVEGEYAVPDDDEDDEVDLEFEPRSARHQELYENAGRFGEPACSIVRGLIDEIYGHGPLTN